MSARDWLDVAGAIVALGAAVAIPIWILIEFRGNRIWARVEDCNPEKFVTRDEWEASVASQAQRIAEVIIAPLQRITDRLDTIGIQMAATQARQDMINQAIKEELGYFRDDIKSLRRAIKEQA